MTSLGNITPTEGGGFDPVPAGKYICEIIDNSEPTEARSGNGQWIKATWKILNGEYAGRLIFQTINFRHSNPMAQEIGLKQLGQIAFATAHDGVDFDLAQVHRIPCLLSVQVRTDPTGQYEPQNDIRRIEKLPAPAQQKQPERTVPRQAEAAKTSAPWR